MSFRSVAARGNFLEIDLDQRLPTMLEQLQREHQLRVRQLTHDGAPAKGYYSKTLYYDEQSVADNLRQRWTSNAPSADDLCAFGARQALPWGAVLELAKTTAAIVGKDGASAVFAEVGVQKLSKLNIVTGYQARLIANLVGARAQNGN